MKLSHLQQAYNLAMERRQAALSLADMEAEDAADAVEVTVSGWQVLISDEVAETISGDAIATAREHLAALDKQLVALGVVLDIAPDEYEHRSRMDGCGDPSCMVCNQDDAEANEDEEAEPAEEAA